MVPGAVAAVAGGGDGGGSLHCWPREAFVDLLDLPDDTHDRVGRLLQRGKRVPDSAGTCSFLALLLPPAVLTCYV